MRSEATGFYLFGCMCMYDAFLGHWLRSTCSVSIAWLLWEVSLQMPGQLSSQHPHFVSFVIYNHREAGWTLCSAVSFWHCLHTVCAVMTVLSYTRAHSVQGSLFSMSSTVLVTFCGFNNRHSYWNKILLDHILFWFTFPYLSVMFNTLIWCWPFLCLV